MEAETATLSRCRECEDDDEKPTEEPLIDWEKVKETVRKNKTPLATAGAIIVVGGAIVLAPETGGGSLAILALF